MVARSTHGEAWRLGAGAIALGALALRANDLVSVARPELESLVRETGETATLEVLVGDEVLILDGVEGPSLVGASSEVGTRWPAHATSTGKVLLSHARPALRSSAAAPGSDPAHDHRSGAARPRARNRARARVGIGDRRARDGLRGDRSPRSRARRPRGRGDQHRRSRRSPRPGQAPGTRGARGAGRRADLATPRRRRDKEQR